jgi:hypothetical protein
MFGGPQTAFSTSFTFNPPNLMQFICSKRGDNWKACISYSRYRQHRQKSRTEVRTVIAARKTTACLTRRGFLPQQTPQ